MRADAATALVTALAALWRRVQCLHPDVPDVVLLPAPGPRNVLGHFAPVRWQAKGTGGRVMHEVVVVAEHLERNAADIAETVLHEAVHAMNHQRGVKDCSTTSQYHNDRFRLGALEMGLGVMKVANYGWAYTFLPPETRELYADEIDALGDVLVHRRSADVRLPKEGDADSADSSSDSDTPGGEKPKGRLLKATC
ncbi:MAG: hypothetical protein IV100_30775, partial [Myxococcales bacterium]|nr:hypothetical protein [Myxococcales bacterium]